MKKKIGLYVVVLLLVGLTAYIFVKKAKKTTLDSDSAAFSFNDTAKVTKIHIREKNGDEAVLERKDGVWMINGKYPARKNNVELLLYTLKQIAVKYPTSDKAAPTVIQSIATIGKRVDFYNGNDKVKVWYMGGTTPDHLGTYMVLGDTDSDDKQEQPYVTYIPGFEGFLNSRFFTSQNDWKSNVLVNTSPPQMKTVMVEHTGMPDSSFIIQVLDINRFRLTDLKNKDIKNADTFAIKQYLSYCSRLDVNTYLTGKSNPELDSVKRSAPFTTITISLKDGSEQKMKLFNKKQPVDEVDSTLGVNLLKDPNYAYLLFNKDQEFALVQYVVFGKLIQSRSYFTHPAFVKK